MLNSVKVQNYRSIVDSGTVELNQRTTTLVGGNEAGKTNFLKSLTLLGDSKEITRDNLCDYVDDELSTKNKSEIQVLEVEIPSQSLSSDSGTFPIGQRRYMRKEGSEEVIFVERPENEGGSATIRRYADGTHRVIFNNSTVEKGILHL